MVRYLKLAVKGASVTLIFSVLASIVAYFTRIFLARTLTPESYGLFYAVFTVILFLLFFRDLGMGQALVKYIAEFLVQKKYDSVKTAISSVFVWQVLSSTVVVLILFFSADYLALHYFKNLQAAFILKILLFYVLFSIFFLITKQIFQGYKEMSFYSSLELAKNTVVLILIFIFSKIGFPQNSPVFAYALVCPIVVILYLPFLRRFKLLSYKIKNFFPVSKKIALFGVPVFATAIGGRLVSYIDTIILTYFGTLTEVGIYNVVLPSALIFLFFGRAIASVTFPISSELWVKEDTKRLSQGVIMIHKYVFVLTIPLIMTIVAYSKFFITTFFGAEYASGSLALQILLIGVQLYVVASINNNIISGIGKPAVVTKIILFSAAINIILNLILIPRFGIEGAAITTSFSYLVTLLLSTYKVTRFVKIKNPFISWTKMAAVSILFLVLSLQIQHILSLNPWIELGISFIIAGFVYLIMIELMGVIQFKEVLKQINKIITK